METEVQREARGSVLESDRASSCGLFLSCFPVFDLFLTAFVIYEVFQKNIVSIRLS